VPRPYSTRHIITILQNNSFHWVSQKGSHAKYKKHTDAGVITVIVPVSRKEIVYGTFHAILFQSKLKKEDFS
jgi:predicted RNA binding protein YcfA (HicA-like mRNA interferase family)